MVAAVNELYDHHPFVNNAAAAVLSPTNRCHTWDVEANCYLLVVLKRVSNTAPHCAYSNLLSCVVSSSGKSSTITAPNSIAQERIICGEKLTAISYPWRGEIQCWTLGVCSWYGWVDKGHFCVTTQNGVIKNRTQERRNQTRGTVRSELRSTVFVQQQRLCRLVAPTSEGRGGSCHLRNCI